MRKKCQHLSSHTSLTNFQVLLEGVLYLALGEHSLTKTNLGLIVTAAVANHGTIVTAAVLLASGTSYVRVKAQFATQPVAHLMYTLRPNSQHSPFQSRLAGFETG